MPCMLLSDLTYLYYLPQEAFVIIFSMYLDFNCACAKERCSPGSLRIALRTPASSLWLDITLLSKISLCSSPSFCSHRYDSVGCIKRSYHSMRTGLQDKCLCRAMFNAYSAADTFFRYDKYVPLLAFATHFDGVHRADR